MSADDHGAERIAGFYAQAPAASRVNLALGAIATGVMWGRTAPELLTAFVMWVILSNAVRLGVWRARLGDPHADTRWRLWARRCTLAMALSGLVWGVGSSVMISPDAPLLLAFWMILVTGIAAGVVAANAFHLPAMWAYLLPLLIPPQVRMATFHGFEYLAIAAGLGLFLVFCLQQGIHQSRLIRDSFRMRAEKATLLEQLQAETREARAARAQAEASAQAKARFFAAASHDLRQPVQAVSLYAAALAAAPLPDSEQRCVTGIGASVQALTDLFDELIEYARLDSGALASQPRPVRLNLLLDRLRHVFGPQAQAAGVNLHFGQRAPLLITDEVLLTRLLGNLIGNALKYAPGAPVAVLARRRGAYWRIEVRDRGPGIAAAAQALIFEEFYQLGNPDRDPRHGFGLGLPTAARLAELLGGRLGVRSHPGCGSTFWVDLPAATLAPPSGQDAVQRRSALLPA